jgi:hypothetical protein
MALIKRLRLMVIDNCRSYALPSANGQVPLLHATSAAISGHAAGAAAAARGGGTAGVGARRADGKYRYLLCQVATMALWTFRLLQSDEQRFKGLVAVFADVFEDGHNFVVGR